MAKRIIKNTMTEPQEMTCPHCGSIFTYTYEDIQRISPPFSYIALYGCEANAYRAVICPVCKSIVELDRVVVVKEDENE